MLRTVLLVLCFARGGFCPWLSALRPLMPVCLVYMLVAVFLRMDFTPRAIDWRHGAVLAANLATAFAVWGGLLLCGVPERFAQAAFFTAVTPTASAAPVIINLLGGSVTFGSMGFLLGALVVSAAFPLAIPVVLHQSAWAALPAILARVCLVALLPFAIALLLRRRFGERARAWGRRLTPSTLYVWIVLVAIIAASASRTLEEHAADYPRADILWVLLIDFLLCVSLFALGALLGGPRHRRECSQLLGQKNTSYTVYLAFACGAPFAALGPAFYVFFHNAWNGLQLIAHERRCRRAATPPSSPPA